MKNNLSKCLLAAVIIMVLTAVPAAAWAGTSSERIYPEGDLMPGESVSGMVSIHFLPNSDVDRIDLYTDLASAVWTGSLRASDGSPITDFTVGKNYIDGYSLSDLPQAVVLTIYLDGVVPENKAGSRISIMTIEQVSNSGEVISSYYSPRVLVSGSNRNTEPLTASFTFSPRESDSLTIHFQGDSDTARTWFWDFDDGTYSSSQSPTHTFPKAGTYAVSLTVEDVAGQSYTTTQWIEVTGNKDAAHLTVAFVANPDERNPLKVYFTGISELADTWYWNFGDGSYSYEQSPIHTYTAPGSYTVSLTGVTPDKQTQIVTHTVEVGISATPTIQTPTTKATTATVTPSQTATVDQGIPKNMVPLLIGGLAGLIIFIILLYILLRPKKKNHAGEQQNTRSQNAATKPVTNQVIYQYTIQGDVHSEKIGILAKDDAVVNRSAVGGKTETQATTRFCPSCGKQVPADAKYCLFCGRQLRP